MNIYKWINGFMDINIYDVKFENIRIPLNKSLVVLNLHSSVVLRKI